MRAGAPVPMLTINSVAPTIMRFGTDEQKDFFLPKILSGDIHFCIGYSEPGAGTDLASLTTRAVRDGDEYVINGQKMWTSLAMDADYCWLAVRTNPEVKKHQGISLIIVPMDTPGITVSPLDEVPGIGPSRKRALLQHFGSAKAVSRAGIADLESVGGISAQMAKTIYDHFHG